MARASNTKLPKKAGAIKGNRPLCSTAPRAAPRLSDAVMGDARRARAIVQSRAKWLNGTVIHYCFFTGGHHLPCPRFRPMRSAGVRAVEGGRVSASNSRKCSNSARRKSASDIRWPTGASAVGGRPRGVDHSARRADDPVRVGPEDPVWQRYRIARARPRARHGARASESVCRASSGTKRRCTHSLAKPPNSWSRATTFHNILEKLSTQEVEGSSWDPDSIMEYEFEPGLIDEPDKYDSQGLSAAGHAFGSGQGVGAQMVSGRDVGAGVARAFQIGCHRSRRGPAGRFHLPSAELTQVHDCDQRRLRHDARALRGRGRKAALPLRRR